MHRDVKIQFADDAGINRNQAASVVKQIDYLICARCIFMVHERFIWQIVCKSLAKTPSDKMAQFVCTLEGHHLSHFQFKLHNYRNFSELTKTAKRFEFLQSHLLHLMHIKTLNCVWSSIGFVSHSQHEIDPSERGRMTHLPPSHNPLCDLWWNQLRLHRTYRHGLSPLSGNDCHTTHASIANMRTLHTIGIKRCAIRTVDRALCECTQLHHHLI